jgi:orotidine-5'-phosphate decarboxylase
VSALGASLLTVHASGGEAMVRAAVEGAAEGGGDCGILAVTVLTSFDAASLSNVWGRDPEDLHVGPEVMRLAAIALAAQARGIVCSGQELGMIAEMYGTGLRALVPGIRLPGGDAHDQVRVMTPGLAATSGARWLVLGRAVTAGPDPAGAMAQVWAELR